jgi:hypothetical protein
MKVKNSEAPGGRVVANFGKILSFMFWLFVFKKQGIYDRIFFFKSFSQNGENSPQKIIHWFDVIAKLKKKGKRKKAVIHNLPRNHLGTAGASS